MRCLLCLGTDITYDKCNITYRLRGIILGNTAVEKVKGRSVMSYFEAGITLRVYVYFAFLFTSRRSGRHGATRHGFEELTEP